jgi:acetyl esterase/lipase
MTNDHAILIPTRWGPIGAVVTEPRGHALAAAALLVGIGGHRHGGNALWTQLARSLAAEGWIVFRADYPGSGESALISSRNRTNTRPVEEAVRWFRQRTDGLSLLSIGICYGAQPATRLAASDPNSAGLLLICPYLRNVPGSLNVRGLTDRLRHRLGRPSRPTRQDRSTQRSLDAVLERQPCGVLVGEFDPWRDDVSAMRDSLGDRGRAMQVITVGGIALHKHSTLTAQHEIQQAALTWARAETAPTSNADSSSLQGIAVGEMKGPQ